VARDYVSSQTLQNILFGAVALLFLVFIWIGLGRIL